VLSQLTADGCPLSRVIGGALGNLLITFPWPPN